MATSTDAESSADSTIVGMSLPEDRAQGVPVPTVPARALHP